MICPNCGTEVQDGSLACPNCAASLPLDDNVEVFSGGNAMLTPPKKSNTGLIIGIVCGVVALIAIAIVCVVFIFGSGKNGTYVCKEMSDYGVNATLKVNGNQFTLKVTAFGETEKESGTIKFSSNTVKLTVDGETVEGKYNKSKKSITFEGMTFTKK